ncbi:transglycosylase-like protein with SLT domain [Labedaea rhizosphaerae]|uniref:Transglycosylase-like protein with SLT domain n=2 Tax=Labedaea rhizosphaerae TaxID=598644 RepID=A0A4R6S9A8_LABRH|nr:transglycosylase-like protein with SLT domain [Labedaea rhizosphaerae]
MQWVWARANRDRTLVHMSHLSAEQIANYAYRAGFRGTGLSTAVAVALAESGGDPKAHNGVPPDNSYGLWQINMIGALGPDRRHQYHLKSNDELFDPATNARVANSISSDGHDFGPWSTYTNGAYKKYLHKARVAAHHATKTHGGKKPHDRLTTGGKQPDGHSGGKGDYSVDTSMLGSYAGGSKQIAESLVSTDGKQLASIHGIAEHSFGRIGKESGFADALQSFGTSMHHQVDGISKNVTNLAHSVTKISKSYDDDDQQLAQQLLHMIE